MAFPGPGSKRQISVNGGTQPRWRRDGRELFFLEGSRLMAVDVVLQHGALEIAATHRLFAPLDGSYAVSADAKRFIAPAAPQQARVAPLTLVLNWPAALKN